MNTSCDTAGLVNLDLVYLKEGFEGGFLDLARTTEMLRIYI
jgi:hypothetical protein